MKGASTFIKNSQWLSMTAAVVAGVLFVTMAVNASTTISANIATGGSVFATSTVVADGAITGYSTLDITGLTKLVNASTTQISNSGLSWFTGLATLGNASTSQVSASGASWFTGLMTLGNASTSQVSASSDVWITGNTTVGGTLGVTGTATHSGLTTLTGTTTLVQSLILTHGTASTGNCIEMYATSTATKVSLVFVASSTPTTVGYLGYNYGSCN